MVQGEHFSLNPGFWDLPKDIFYVYLVIAFLSGVGTKSANTCFSICWHHSSITLQLALKSSANKQFLYVSICVYISIYVTIHHLSSTKPIWPDTSESGEDCVNVHCTIFTDFFGMPVCSVMSDSLQRHGLWPVRLLCPCNFPGKNIGVGIHFLLQGIFPTQGSIPVSPALSGRFFTTVPPGKPYWLLYMLEISSK